jgi:hypothetical protein
MTEETRYVPVPSPEAGWRQISEFAVTINGSSDLAFEGTAGVGASANQASGRWHQDRELPDDLLSLRGCLFFEQRRAGKATMWDPWVEWDNPKTECGDWIDYIRALVEKIRNLSGGTVEVRNDLWEPWDEK